MDVPIAVLLLVTLIALAVGAHMLGARRWAAGTRDLRRRLVAAQTRMKPEVADFAELDPLPVPVQRYFRTVLQDGQPMVTRVHLRHQGSFNMGSASDKWRRFTSDQLVITQRPGFDWDARIAMAAGLSVCVHDAYLTGEGILSASLFGLVPLARLRGGRELAEGELMRFLAEAAWYPTALLPSQGVTWKAAGINSAQATLSDGAVEVALLFSFNDAGQIDSVSTEARRRIVKGKFEAAPWKGRFWNYRERDGMQVPLEGEVAWILEGDPQPYWRGSLTEISYESS